MGMFDKVKDNAIVSKAKELDEKNKEKKQAKAELKIIEGYEKQRIKKGEAIIKEIMGTNRVRNTKFNARIVNQGVSAFKVPSVWKKINKQIKMELEAGTVELENIPNRIDQLLVENGNPEKIQEKIEKSKINEMNMRVVGFDFTCTLNEKRMGTFNQKEDVVYGFCFVNEDRLIIKKRSVFTRSDVGDKIVPYANINAIDYDKAGKFQVTSSIVISISGFDSIILKHTKDADFQLLHDAWLNFNSKSNEPVRPQVIETRQSTDADELLKYAELYEKGLLTKEEFELKKSEIMGISTNQNDDIKDVKKQFCTNCGSSIDSESSFCPHCGNPVN